jgi:HEAT repeat protein
MSLVVRGRLLHDTNTEVVQRAVLLLGRIGGPEAEARLERLARHRAPEIRAAAVAASLHIPTLRAGKIAKRGAADPHRDVRRVALVVMTARAFRAGRPASMLLGAADPDEVIRSASLLGHVYLQGSNARKGLLGLMTRQHKKDVRELAGRLVALLDRYPPAARRYAMARLQAILDDEGVAACWNLNRSVTDLVRQILRIENARPRGGAGPAPGGASAAERQAVRRYAAHAEDLYLHLDAWPLFDKRPRTEMPQLAQ